jgi:hypothetical protein
MPLMAGERLGPYEILAPIGAGGMGEVYKARDTKLDRDVPTKVLPAVLAQDPERLARLERESGVSIWHAQDIVQAPRLDFGSGRRGLLGCQLRRPEVPVCCPARGERGCPSRDFHRGSELDCSLGEAT